MLMLGLHGATGKMGRAIAEVCDLLDEVEILHKYSGSSAIEDLDSMFQECEVIIDFSAPKCLVALLAKALQYKKPVLIGTTGIGSEIFQQIHSAAKKIPIFYSANMSIGVNLLAKAVRLAASILNESEYDADILEIHHKHKKDAPSGTALLLGQRIAEARGRSLDDIKVCNRAERMVIRSVGDVDFSSLRAGVETGLHEVIFSGKFETLSFKHQAHSRKLYAESAVKIAKWLVCQSAGFYAMDDYTANLWV